MPHNIFLGDKVTKSKKDFADTIKIKMAGTDKQAHTDGTLMPKIYDEKPKQSQRNQEI